MIQIVLTPDQLRQIKAATDAIELVDDRGHVLGRLDSGNPDSVASQFSRGETYTSISDLIEDLGEWDAADVQRRLNNLQSAGTLSDSLAMLPLENTKSGFARWRRERE